MKIRESAVDSGRGRTMLIQNYLTEKSILALSERAAARELAAHSPHEVAA
jgi:hypothetical protein